MKPSIEKVKHDLELDEDLKTHIRAWKIQRVGWVFMVLVFIMAVLGIFGAGFLSHRSINKEGIKVAFEYFGRYEADMEVTVSMPDPGVSTLTIPRDYLDRMKLKQIFPEPDNVKMEGGHYLFSFSPLAQEKVVLYILPQSTGSFQSTLMINNQPFTINHFIYP